MARMEKLAQKLESTRAEKTKEVERELGLPKPGIASMSMDLLKSIFKKLKGEQEPEQPQELPPGSVIPPTPVIGGGGG
jgi:hypothetical protein